jgi:cell division protein FtsI/penicillin-binding protein 2
MGAHTRRNVIAGATVVALAVAGYAIAGSGDGSAKGQPAAELSVTSPLVSTADQSTPSPADSTPDDPPSSSSPTDGDSGSDQPGGFASDGVTPLSAYPSLVKFNEVFLNSNHHVVTTIDPAYQDAAASAVGAHPDSAMVVIRASTGAILAMASQGAADLAYHAERAPGSTFKVVTAEDLLRNGLTPDSPAPCPAKDPTYGVTNDDTALTKSTATLRYGFVNSCNTSFTGLMPRLYSSPLSQEASTYFGLNQPWNLGVGSVVYGAADGAVNVPAAKGEYFADEMFGQGQITMSPLNMASVAATVAAGQFHQPFLMPGVDATATARPLPKTVAADLRSMMREAVTEGTAFSLKAVSPAVSAKTGTAQTGDGGGNDSWMIAFQGDIAVACLVEHGGHGNDAAGPEIAAMFGGLH